MYRDAVGWIRANAIGARCVPISHRKRQPYPEVTGYCIPTLLQVGEHRLAENFARFLISAQNTDGSFSLDDAGEKFVFDTGQVIRGWLSIASRMPEVLDPMRRACDWIVNGADQQTGRFAVPSPRGQWHLGARGEISEGIHVYVVEPMRRAARFSTSDISHAPPTARSTGMSVRWI